MSKGESVRAKARGDASDTLGFSEAKPTHGGAVGKPPAPRVPLLGSRVAEGLPPCRRV